MQARPSAAAPAKAPQDYFGAGNFDSDHFGEGDAGIALDTGEAAGPQQTAAPFMGSSVSLAGDDDDLDLYEGSRANAQAMASRPPATAGDTKKWPTGRTPEVASLSIDRVEVDVLSGYGPPPENLLLSPLYAARVLQRRRELSVRVAELAARFAEAEAERDRLLVSLAQEVRGQLAMSDEGDKYLEPVKELEKVALERRDHLSGASAEYGRFTEEVKAQASALRDACTAAEAKVRGEASQKLEQAELAFQRADAKKKRAYIEIRAIVEASEKAGGVTPPQQAARLGELERMVAEQRPEHEAAHAALLSARAYLGQAEEEKRHIERKIRDMERDARARNDAFTKQLGTRSAGVTEAEAERARALADVGRIVLAARGRLVDVRAEVLAPIERADESVAARAMELAKHMRALDGHDAPALKAGIAIIVGAALLVLAVLLWAVLG